MSAKKASKTTLPTAAEIVEGFGKRGYWLLKSEPGAYSLDDLERDGETYWDGVRNYQARNLMRDFMGKGDLALYYHSNADPTGVVGIARISGEAYPDPTQLDPKDPHYDPKADPENPPWVVVDVAYEGRFETPVTLQELKEEEALEGMLVTRRGQRLSVQPVSEAHFRQVCRMGGYRL